MTFNLSWDLFIIVFFTIIVAYSFIIGKNQTVKVILSSYVGILTADGVGNLIEKYFIGASPLLDVFSSENSSSLVIMRISIFILIVVILSINGGFEISLPADNSQGMEFLMTLTFSILSAGLIISTVLLYATGVGFVGNAATLPEAFVGSKLAEVMIVNYSAWFTTPAFFFVLASFVAPKEELEI